MVINFWDYNSSSSSSSSSGESEEVEEEEEEACTSDSDDSDGKASDSLSENTVLRQEAVRPPVAARPLPGSGSGSLESQAQRLSAQQRELSDEIQR